MAYLHFSHAGVVISDEDDSSNHLEGMPLTDASTFIELVSGGNKCSFRLTHDTIPELVRVLNRVDVDSLDVQLHFVFRVTLAIIGWCMQTHAQEVAS